MSYWKSKVLPKLKKLVKKRPAKGQAAEACKSFDKSKDTVAKEIEENKEVLQPKVLAIYQSSNIEAQGLLKEPTESGVSEFIEVVQNLLVELSNAGCPGAQTLGEAATKHGPSAMAEPIVFLFSKLAVFVSVGDASNNAEQRERELELPTEDEQKTTPDLEDPAPDTTPKSAAQDVAVHS